jgi:hypothetical protein
LILRSVLRHVRDQNWFAVFLDFLIVVVGVFIGIQVANWNDERREAALGVAYLERLGDDLVAMETHLEDTIEDLQDSHSLSAALLDSASQPDVDDTELTKATRAFITTGWSTPNLTMIDTVFEDLSSTGNFGLIDEAIWQQVSTYYAGLERLIKGLEINQDWALRNDSRLAYDHDLFLWDEQLDSVLGRPDEERLRQSVTSARTDLARLATTYYYIQRSSLNSYQSALEDTRRLIRRIESASQTRQ